MTTKTTRRRAKPAQTQTPREQALAALKALAANTAGAPECGLSARRTMAQYAMVESWDESQLKKGGDGFTAIGAMVEEAGLAPSLASKMRGIAHPRVCSQFAAMEAAAVRLQQQHSGAVLRYLDQLSSLIRKEDLAAEAAESVIQNSIAEKSAKDNDRERIKAFQTWLTKSAMLKKKIGLLERKALEDALATALGAFNSDGVAEATPEEPQQPQAQQPAGNPMAAAIAAAVSAGAPPAAIAAIAASFA